MTVLAAFAASCLMLGHAQAQGTQRPRRAIELSETNSAEILTNLNQLSTKKDGFQQLEDQLRTLKGLSSGSSFERRLNAPPYVPQNASAVPTKALKDLLERQKNWALAPEETGSATGSSDADALSGFGDEKMGGKQSSLKQFYDALNHSGPGRKNIDRFNSESGPSNSKQRGDFSDENRSTDDANLPAGIREKAQRLREAATEEPDSLLNQAAKPRSSFENFFGLNNSRSIADTSRGPKTQMESFVDQFKKVLDGPSSVSGLDPSFNGLLPGNGNPAPKAASYPTLDSLPTSTHHELTETPPGNVNAVVSRNILPDVNATVLNQWNPMYTPPKPLELPKFTPPTPPNAQFPRRHF